MDLIKLLVKNPRILIITLAVFYLVRTNSVDLSNHNEIHKIITNELQRTYLNKNLLQDLSKEQQESIEENTITIEKMIGRYSASKFVTTQLYLKVICRLTPDSPQETRYYQLKFDPINNQWFIVTRYNDGLVWRIAI